jgi:uncharacterized protein YigA (DUF484 family)
MDEFWSDSPLHKELRHALKRQMSTLRDKNKELELQVEGLEEKIKVNVSFFKGIVFAICKIL